MVYVTPSLQVCPTTVGMFDGMDLIQELHLEDLLAATSGRHSPEGVIVVSAQISDPYVLLNLSSGVSIVLQGDPDSMTLEPLQV